MSDPLQDWRILIGRPGGRATGLISLLSAAGAGAQATPFIEISPVPDSAQLDALVLDLADGHAEWVVFTSVNAVASVLDRAQQLGVGTPISAALKVAAVGPATADALRRARIPVDLCPTGAGSARALVDIFPAASRHQLVLLPRSALADEVVPDGLHAKGYEITCVDAYRTVERSIPPSVTEDLQAGRYEAVVVTSSSGVPVLAAAAPAPSTLMVAIGGPTAAALAAAGFGRVVVASTPDDAGVLDALIGYAGEHRAGSTAGSRPGSTPGSTPSSAMEKEVT